MIRTNRMMGDAIAGMMALAVCFCVLGCEKKKEGKVAVTAQEFSIRKEEGFKWTIDATGKVRNVGEVDVKNVVVTGYCRSCGEVFVGGAWYVSDVEKLPEQKDTINFLPVGAEETFHFKDVAFYFNHSGLGPSVMPDKLEVSVVSLETADNR